MARVVLARTAVADLERIVRSHSLAPNTPQRLAKSLAGLRDFPKLVASLAGRCSGLRFVLGPWRWLLCVYIYNETSDTVTIVTFQDGRSSKAATAES